MEDKIIHVVTAHRTTKSQHSYVVGLYENAEDAVQSAEIESLNRGRKYAMRTTSYVLNKLPEDFTEMELSLPIYRQTIDDLLESIEHLAFHVQARKLAPTLTTKLFHMEQETLIREHQERYYKIIEAHEREDFRITTPYRTRARFDELHPMKIFNIEEE